MAQITWDPVALDDLEEIARYIERDSLAAARRLIQRMFDRVEQLKRSPRSGGFLEEDRRQIYRQLIQGNYRLIYRCHGNDVFIVAVYRAARLLPSNRIP
jgi:toxin ParE1/3/4